jgi:hypothetical protein
MAKAFSGLHWRLFNSSYSVFFLNISVISSLSACIRRGTLISSGGSSRGSTCISGIGICILSDQLLLGVVLDEAGGSRLRQFFKLLLTIVVATQVRHIGRILRELYRVPAAYQVEATYLFL